MSEVMFNLEGLLEQVLAPIEPPDDFAIRLEGALTSITEIAAEELEAWELSAMRDPRNWLRPAAAVVVGGSAGAALLVLRARNRTRADASLHGVGTMAARAASDLREQARRLAG